MKKARTDRDRHLWRKQGLRWALQLAQRRQQIIQMQMEQGRRLGVQGAGLELGWG